MFDNEPPFTPEPSWAVPGQDRPYPVAASAAVRTLTRAVDALAEDDPAAVDGPEVLLQTAALFAQAQRLQLLALAHLAEVDRRELYALDGVSSTGRWVESLAVGADRTSVAVARRLSAFPTVRSRVLDGRVGLAQAHQLQVALTRVRPHLDRPDGRIDGHDAEQALAAVVLDGVPMLVAQARGGFASDGDPVLRALHERLSAGMERPEGQLARLEAALVLLAEHVEPGQLSGALGLLVDALLPEQHDRRAERAHDRRGLRLTRSADGAGWHLTGSLDLRCGERLFAVLQAELRRDPDSPLDTELAAELRAQGLDPYDPELGSARTPRTASQRLHDALDSACGRYLEDGLGGTHDKLPVQVVVTVPVEALDDAPGALPGRSGSGASLPRRLVRRWVCGSALTRQVLDLRGKVLATSHTQRTLTGAERRALWTQTAGACQGAGCRRSSRVPGTVLHPHHANPWSRTGSTSLADTALVCDSCHAGVHSGRVLRLKDGRRLGPDGWVPAPSSRRPDGFS